MRGPVVIVRDGNEVRRFATDKMQKANLFETPRLFCDLYCFEPGQEQKVHLHESSEKVYYVLEGRGTFRIGDQERELGPQQATIAPPGVPHGVRNHSAERLVVLTMMTPRP